jgi:hypothetical protein
MTGMAVKVATAEEGSRLVQLLKADADVAAVHPVVSNVVTQHTTAPLRHHVHPNSNVQQVDE